MTHRKVSIRGGLLCSVSLLSGILLCASEGEAQRLSRRNLLSRPVQEYENYALQGYRRTGRQEFDRATTLVFDDFGNLLMDGVELYRLSESHPGFDDPTTEPRESGSRLQKSLLYHEYLARLVLAKDTYAGSNQRLIIGDRIRTRFTSLTMDMAALNGIRWDGDFGRHDFSLVTSRLDKPIYELEAIFSYEDNVHYDSRVEEVRGLSRSLLAAFLLGGYAQTRIGMFDLGMTYLNQFRVDTQVGLAQNSMKGTLPVHDPGGIGVARRPSFIEYLVVKIADETERDGQGARAYDVRISLNGVERDDIRPVITRHDTEVLEQSNLGANANNDRLFPRNRTIPPYVEFIKSSVAPEPFLPTETAGEQGLEASGTEYLLYWFAMPEAGTREVHFEALVANDYEISVSEVYVSSLVPKTANRPQDRNRATYFYRVAGSQGRVTDLSNLGWVGFDYGRQTGVTLGGISLSTAVAGFRLSAEYNLNWDFRQYPDLGGQYHQRRAEAYYVNLKKDVGPGFLGGELFSISPHYTTTLSIQDGSVGLYGAVPFFTDLGGTIDETRNTTMELDLVDDNDDRDVFPENHFLPAFSDRDGVFPGLDADLDGRPDINQNNNSLPDYLEPFLLYYVDPDDYAYGDDMNNNGVIDRREDDDKPDYPYDRDSEGVHLFTGGSWDNGLQLTLGLLDMRQVLGGGRNWMRYAKAEYNNDEPSLGRIQAVNFLKRVKDTIPDELNRFAHDDTFGPLGPITPVGTRGVNPADLIGIGITRYQDRPLRMRNSVVNTTFVEGRLKWFPGFTVRANAKLDLNSQRKTAFHEANRIQDRTSVVAADYVWKRGNWTVRPQLKYMAQRTTDQKEVVLPAHEVHYYPILRMDYVLSPNSVLKLGVQAPGRYRDMLNDSADYRSEDYLAMVTNTSSYSGYELSFNAGYQLKRRRMDDRSRAIEDIDYSLFFIRMVVGLRASEGRQLEFARNTGT